MLIPQRGPRMDLSVEMTEETIRLSMKPSHFLFSRSMGKAELHFFDRRCPSKFSDFSNEEMLTVEFDKKKFDRTTILSLCGLLLTQATS